MASQNRTPAASSAIALLTEDAPLGEQIAARKEKLLAQIVEAAEAG